MTKKLSFFLFILLSVFCMEAQNYSDFWTGYFSYTTVIDLSEGGEVVFAASQNSVFSYDLTANEIKTYSTIEGLAGETITTVHYSPSTRILFIGYFSGLIDLIKPDGTVSTLVAIRDKPVILPSEKTINNFYENGDILYIATGFGISLFDLSKLEFDDSYFIGDNGARLPILQTTIFEEYIYAASPTGGLRRALASAENLIDFKNWETVDAQGWLGVEASETALLGIKSNKTLQRFDGNSFTSLETFSETPKKIKLSGKNLVLTFQKEIAIYNTEGVLRSKIGELPQYPDVYNAALTLDGQVYLGTGQNGLLISSLNSPDEVLKVVPNGPLRNDPFTIEATPGELWVAYGDYSDAFNPYPLKQRGISKLNKDGWLNIPFSELLGANNITNITINPENSSQVFMSSYNSGLLEIVDNVAVQLYDESNSGLSDIPVNPTDVRINGADFDRQGNLWMTNSLVKNGLAIKTGNAIQGISVEEVLPDFDQVNGYTQVVVDKLGSVYFGSSNRGLIGYDPDSNTFARLNVERSNLPSNIIFSLAIDANGSLWIGTSAGLRILSNPSQMFDNPEVQTRPIIIEENGIAVELLSEQVIRAIAIDGNNNKWIGTVSSGAFNFSANGQETLQQFSTRNSPLPSNNIQDITIDEASGEVFFATPLGLVSFRGNAVAAQENLEKARVFPNPVRPGFNTNVTIDGLTENANVKITDLNGNLVYEEVSKGGSILWDTTAFGKYRVASGVYFILITGEDALETKIVKLMIIR